MVSFDNRVAWVTGGGRGIGRALALALAREGVSVAISSRTDAEINAVAEEIRATGARALAVQADAMSLADTRACAARSKRGSARSTFWSTTPVAAPHRPTTPP